MIPLSFWFQTGSKARAFGSAKSAIAEIFLAERVAAGVPHRGYGRHPPATPTAYRCALNMDDRRTGVLFPCNPRTTAPQNRDVTLM
jgi:hypothetical protein